MEDKMAANILMKVLEKYEFDDEEKEAVRAAIGLFTWTALAQTRLKAKKDKLAKSAKWE